MRTLTTLMLAASAFASGAALAQTAPIASYGFTPSTQAVGAAIDSTLANPVTAATAATYAATVTGQTSPAAANQQLLHLSPTSFQLLPQLSLESANWQDSVVRRYQRDVRQGGTEDANRAVLFGTDRHMGMWLQGGGRTGYFEGNNDRYRTTYGASSAIGGIDYRFSRGTLLGIYGGYDAATARLDALAPQSEINSWFAGGYLSGTVGPVYLDGHGFYGRSDDIARRIVPNGAGSGSLYSTGGNRDPRTVTWGLTGTAGLSFDYMGFEVEPYGGAKYTQVRLRSFNEGDAYDAYSVQGYNTDSLESIAGLRIGGKIPLTATASIRPSIRGEYRHEFENADRDRNLLVNFNDGSGGTQPLVFRTQGLPRDYAAVGAGFTISGKSPVSIVVDYEGEVGGQRRINGVTGGVHLAF